MTILSSAKSNSKLGKILRKLGFKQLNVINSEPLANNISRWYEQPGMRRELLIEHFSKGKPNIYVPIGSLLENYQDVFDATKEIASHMEE